MRQKSTTLGRQILTQGSFTPYSPYSLPIKKARKNRIYDYDRNTYIDFYLHKGSILLGYKYSQLSTLLLNRLSMGFLGGFYTHLHYRAKKTMREYFKSKNVVLEHLILFFPSEKERTSFKEELNISYKTINIQEYREVNNQHSFAFDLSISNGAPIYTLIIPEQTLLQEEPISLDISPLSYQSFITTLQQLEKKDIKQHTSQLVKPFIKMISRTGDYFFTLDISTPEWKKMAPKMLEFGFIVNQENPQIYVCLETTHQDVKNFFSTLNSLLV